MACIQMEIRVASLPIHPIFSPVFLLFPDNWQTNHFAQTDPAINGTTPQLDFPEKLHLHLFAQ